VVFFIFSRKSIILFSRMFLVFFSVQESVFKFVIVLALQKPIEWFQRVRYTLLSYFYMFMSLSILILEAVIFLQMFPSLVNSARRFIYFICSYRYLILQGVFIFFICSYRYLILQGLHTS
jgi:hypothetical protein